MFDGPDQDLNDVLEELLDGELSIADVIDLINARYILKSTDAV